MKTKTNNEKVRGTMTKKDMVDKLLENLIVASMRSRSSLMSKNKNQLFDLLFAVEKASLNREVL